MEFRTGLLAAVVAAVAAAAAAATAAAAAYRKRWMAADAMIDRSNSEFCDRMFLIVCLYAPSRTLTNAAADNTRF